MRIDRLSLTPYDVPFVRPYLTASVRHERRRGLLVEARAGDGSVGLGEAAPLSRSEDLPTCRAALEEAARGLTDASLDEVLAAPGKAVPGLTRAPAARFGLLEALLDLAARARGVPLAREVQTRWGHEGPVPATLPVNATIPHGSLEETVAAAAARADEGFTTLKLKIGHDVDGDPARMAAVRDAVGPDVALRLDANQGWPRDQAAARVDQFADLDVAYIEQPVEQDDLEGLAWLRTRGPLRIAADEPVTGLDGARRVLEAGAADVLVVKPMVLGGPDQALAVVALAAEHGVEVVLTSTIDGVVARAGALHTAAALGPRVLASGFATGHLLARDVAPLDGERIEGGQMHVHQGPGHGIARGA